jgi:hypothetical protein
MSPTRQHDYFLARELFRRAHPVPTLRYVASLEPRPRPFAAN